MDTSLQSAGLALDEVRTSADTHAEAVEEEHHIHLPGPSYWPFLLSGALTVAVTGLFYMPDNPWLLVVSVPLVIAGIMGWALEDPMASEHVENVPKVKKPAPPAQIVLEQARATAARVVTFGSVAYSTHPISVNLEEDRGSEGVVLALNGKVELSSQRDLLTEALYEIDGVAQVKNFVIAEDEILPKAYQRLENLREQGKIEGAQNIEMLVENYILHLYGDVPNNKMKYALEREMIGIPGVRVIVNHIGLNKDIPGNLGKTKNA